MGVRGGKQDGQVTCSPWMANSECLEGDSAYELVHKTVPPCPTRQEERRYQDKNRFLGRLISNRIEETKQKKSKVRKTNGQLTVISKM